MKKYLILTILSFEIFAVPAQNKKEKNPSVQNLDFLIGTWEVDFDWFDTHKPETKPIFSEKGTMTCTYDLDYRGSKKFIICRYKLDTYEGRLKGRYREVIELIQWSKFSNSFERTGLYSNWPATGLETFTFDAQNRTFSVEGKLGVQDGMLERYAELYQFNKNYNEFQRRNVANFSDMPITEYNLTMICVGKKIK